MFFETLKKYTRKYRMPSFFLAYQTAQNHNLL